MVSQFDDMVNCHDLAPLLGRFLPIHLLSLLAKLSLAHLVDQSVAVEPQDAVLLVHLLFLCPPLFRFLDPKIVSPDFVRLVPPHRFADVGLVVLQEVFLCLIWLLHVLLRDRLEIALGLLVDLFLGQLTVVFHYFAQRQLCSLVFLVLVWERDLDLQLCVVHCALENQVEQPKLRKSRLVVFEDDLVRWLDLKDFLPIKHPVGFFELERLAALTDAHFEILWDVSVDEEGHLPDPVLRVHDCIHFAACNYLDSREGPITLAVAFV